MTHRQRMWILKLAGVCCAVLVVAYLVAQCGQPESLPWNAPLYSFEGFDNVAPMPIPETFEVDGVQYQTLRLEPNRSYKHLLFPDFPQFVPVGGILPPTRRVRYYDCYINKFGLRGQQEHEAWAPPGTYRIGVIGTGVTFGEGVGYEQTFSRVLEKLLNEKPLAGKRFEVINAGIPCMTTNFALGSFIRCRRNFHCDFWIFALGVNDALPMFFRSETDYRQDVKRLVRKIQEIGEPSLVLIEPMDTFYPWMDEYLRYRKILEEEVQPHLDLRDMAALLDRYERQKGLRLEVEGNLQKVVQYKEGKPRVLFQDRYTSGAGEQYISPAIYKYLDTHRVSMRTFITDVHLSEFGHRLVAESLYSYLAQRFREGVPDHGTSERGTSERGTSERGTSDYGTSDYGTPERDTPHRGIPDHGIPDDAASLH